MNIKGEIHLEELIIVIEIPKLKGPDDISMKIIGPKANYYFYPDNFVITLKKCNRIINILRTGPIPSKISDTHESSTFKKK